jgi:hypothetical protein
MKTKIVMSLTLIFLLLSIIVNALILVAVSWPISNYSLSTAANFSDGFGLLNVLFSGLAFWGLIWTIVIQINENRQQKVELKKIKITEILMTDAKSCNEEINKVNFSNKSCKIVKVADEISCWELFYIIEGLSHAVGDGEINEEIFINEITALFMENIDKLTFVFERLDRSIDYVRYLLADDEIPVSDVSEIKALYFGNYDDRIFVISSLLSSMISQILKKVENKKGLAPFHPARIITFKIDSINEFRNENVTIDTIRNWKNTLNKSNN